MPALLRQLCDGQRELDLPGATIHEVLAALVARYPAVGPRIFDADGRLQPALSVAVDGEMGLRRLSGAVRPDSELSIIPAMAGGSDRPALA